MKAFKALLVSTVAIAGFAAVDASAQHAHGTSGGTRTWSGSGTHTGSGTNHWSGTRTAGHWGGHYRGGYYPRWHSGVSFYFGVPLLWPAYYWGSPYWGPYYYDYPRTVIYREVERFPAYPEGEMDSAEPVAPSAPGSPTQGPLYMNYCESAKAYYPKVASCPEGWKFIAPGR